MYIYKIIPMLGGVFKGTVLSGVWFKLVSPEDGNEGGFDGV